MVLAPRRIVSGFELVSGSVYRAAFDYGEIVDVFSSGNRLTAAESSTVGSGEWFFDFENSLLYINVDGDPAAELIVAEYELYFGTFDAHWHRSPLDTSSRVVYFEPVIEKSPLIQASVSEAIFGYMPSFATQIAISNVTAVLDRHLYDSSFNAARLDLYHYLLDKKEMLAVDKIKLVYRGITNFFKSTDASVTFKVLDRTNIFDREYRHADSKSFFDESSFPDIDSNFKNRPIRKVFGVLEGVLGINYAFGTAVAVDANNFFALHSGTDNPGSVDATVLTGSTATRTYLDSVDGLRVGDDLWIDSADGEAFDEYPEITLIQGDTVPYYVEHDAIANSAAEDSVAHRSFVGNVRVIMDGVVYRLVGTEWHEVSDPSKGILGVEINQAALSTTPRMLGPYDTVYCRFYGQKNSATMDGDPFGADSALTGNLTHPVVILWSLLKDVIGLGEDEIDVQAFDDLQGGLDDEVGFQVPVRTGENFPSMRELVTSICQTIFSKIFLDDDGLWTIRETRPTEETNELIDNEEILAGKIGYEIDYQDVISDVLVSFAPSEINSRGQVTTDDTAGITVSSRSQIAIELHRITKQKTFRSFHFTESQAQRLADRLRFCLGDRKGTLTLSTKNRFFDTEISSVIEVERERLPGFEYVPGTARTRSFVTQAISKGISEVELTLDDQKGIEDNAGDWD